MSDLWQFPLERVWRALDDHPELKTKAEVHNGIEYNMLLRANWNSLISNTPRPGFAKGLVNVTDDFETFFADSHQYLNLSAEVMRGNAYNRRWSTPKAIVNAHRTSRGPWRLVAVPDYDGLTVYHNFNGIWPTADWPVEVIAAVLNGHVANAFMSLREARDNRIRTLLAVPLPRLSQADLRLITHIVREYREKRSELARFPSAELAKACATMLSEIQSHVLNRYELTDEATAELVEYFARAPHPVFQRLAGSQFAGADLLEPLADLEIDSRLRVENPAVGNFLKQQRGLVTLVNEAVAQVVRFMPDASFRLELLSDPDEGETRQLFIEIFTRLEETDALQALRLFDQEWWGRQIRRAGGLLSIDLASE